MYEDLELYGLRYNAAVTIFFVPYTLLEVPSNIVLKILRPCIWLSILCFCWGLVMVSFNPCLMAIAGHAH